MKIAIMAGFFTEGDVEVDAGHGAKVRLEYEKRIWARRNEVISLPFFLYGILPCLSAEHSR